MRCFLLLLSMGFTSVAVAAGEAPRFTVVTALEGKDFVTGRKVTVPPKRGYKFEIVGAATLRPYMRVYDADGLEVQAYFPIPNSLKEAAAPKKEQKVSEEQLKEEISTGLQATVTGAINEQEGCCEVDDKKEDEKEEKVEAPKPAPKTVPKAEMRPKPAPTMVQAPPSANPQPKPAPVAEPVEETLEIESPPEDFVDVSEHAEMPVPAAAPEPVPAKSAPMPAPAKPVVVEAPESQEEPLLASVPIPEKRPGSDKKRAPALERPVEEIVQLPEVGPVPKFRPDLLDRAAAPRTRGMMGDGDAEAKRLEEEAKLPRRPASASVCRAFDVFKLKGVPEAPLRQALMFLDKNKEKFAGRRYVSIADYSQPSTKRRFYLLDMQNLTVRTEQVSHGGGRNNSGDADHDGMLNGCGGSGSERTRGGFFEVADYYFSQKGRYKWPMLSHRPPRNGMKLKGLTPGVNASVMNDGYVMHEAKYNLGSGAKMGRSDGCPAFAPGRGVDILAKLRGGSLQYHYTPMCREHQTRALNQVRGWEELCK